VGEIGRVRFDDFIKDQKKWHLGQEMLQNVKKGNKKA
jgi:hypothetical protein